MAATSSDELQSQVAVERRARRLRCRFAVDRGNAELIPISDETETLGFAVSDDGIPITNRPSGSVSVQNAYVHQNQDIEEDARFTDFG